MAASCVGALLLAQYYISNIYILNLIPTLPLPAAMAAACVGALLLLAPLANARSRAQRDREEGSGGAGAQPAFA